MAAGEIIAYGADAGGGPHVKVYKTDGTILNLTASFFPYAAGFRGGVRVAVGDVNGDGTDDLVTGAGPGGGPHVRIFDGAQLLLGNQVELAGFFAFPATVTTGVYVAVGRFDSTQPPGRRQVVVSTGEGGTPRVRIFNISGGTATQIPGPLADFLAYDPAFTGGVRVAAGNLTPAANDDLAVAPGPGGGPHVKVFNGDTGLLEGGGFFAYDATFTGGVYVAVGKVDPAATSDQVITGPGPGGVPEVKVFKSTGLFKSFLCYESGFTGGVRVGVFKKVNEVICTPGPGYPPLAQLVHLPFPSVGDDGAGFGMIGVIIYPNFRGGFFGGG